MRYQLILSDVDSTLIEDEVIDLLAARTPFGNQVADITNRAMSGELDFASALNKRVSLLKGLKESDLDAVASMVTMSKGAEELKSFCISEGIRLGAVTGGFREILKRINFFDDFDYLEGNSLEIKDGVLTGLIGGPILDRSAKALHLDNFANLYSIPMEATIAIGDGANDLEMIKRAGLGVAFRAKSILKEVADVAIEDSLAQIIELIQKPRAGKSESP